MPETNVAWLGHLLRVLLDAANFSFDEEGKGEERDKREKEEDDEEEEEQVAWLRRRLGELWRVLDPDREGEGFKSAGEVLAWEVLGMGEEDVGRVCDEESDIA